MLIDLMLTRRDLIASAAAAALPEVGAPSTPDARLREAALRWERAEAAVAATLRTYQSAREQIYAAMVDGSGARALARLVEARVAARSEWRSAQREAAEAEAQMESAARWVREG